MYSSFRLDHRYAHPAPRRPRNPRRGRRHARDIIIRLSRSAQRGPERRRRRVRPAQQRRARAPQALPFPRYGRAFLVVHPKRQWIRPLARKNDLRTRRDFVLQRTIHARTAKQHEHFHFFLRRQARNAGQSRQAVPVAQRRLLRQKRLQRGVRGGRRRHDERSGRILAYQAGSVQVALRRAFYGLPVIVEVFFARLVPYLAVDGARLQFFNEHGGRALDAGGRLENRPGRAAREPACSLRNASKRLWRLHSDFAMLPAPLSEFVGDRKRIAFFRQGGGIKNRFVLQNALRRRILFKPLTDFLPNCLPFGRNGP